MSNLQKPPIFLEDFDPLAVLHAWECGAGAIIRPEKWGLTRMGTGGWLHRCSLQWVVYGLGDPEVLHTAAIATTAEEAVWLAIDAFRRWKRTYEES